MCVCVCKSVTVRVHARLISTAMHCTAMSILQDIDVLHIRSRVNERMCCKYSIVTLLLLSVALSEVIQSTGVSVCPL